MAITSKRGNSPVVSGGGGSSNTHGHGTLANLPSKPAANGDSYEVDAGGVGGGRVYYAANGVWSLISPGSNTLLQFVTGNGWTIEPPAIPGEGTASFEVDGGDPVGRITLSSPGQIRDLDGPRIERPFPASADGSFLVSVRIRNFTPLIYPALYFRDAVTSEALFVLPDTRIAGVTPTWAIAGPIASNLAFNGSYRLAVRRSGAGTALEFGLIDGTTVWAQYFTLPAIAPTHYGIAAFADGAWNGSVDFDDFTLETF